MDLDRARAATANPFDPAGRYHDSAADRRQLLEDGSEAEDTDQLYAESDRGKGGNDAEAIANRHAVLQQLKIGVLLAALDGLSQPQDAHWHAAGAIMAVRRGSIEELVALTEHQREAMLRERAGEMGQVTVEAKAAGDTHYAKRVEHATAHATFEAMTLTEQGKPITRAALMDSFDRDEAEVFKLFAVEAIRRMTSTGLLVPNADNLTYTFDVLGRAEESDNAPATVRVMRAAVPAQGVAPGAGTGAPMGGAPVISTIGG